MTKEDLQNIFKKATEKNSKFSKRSFARLLRIDSGTLTAYLSGRRKISVKAADQITEQLRHIYPELRKIKSPSKEIPDATFDFLAEDVFQMISEWEHYAILSFLETDGAKKTTAQISRRLGISDKKTRDSLKILEKLGFVRRKDERWEVRSVQISSPHEIPSSAIKKSHISNIQKSLQSLLENRIEERDFTGMTMAVDFKKIPEAKIMIHRFRRELCRFLESGHKNEVYRLNIQLFPLTKLEEK